jgi:adenylate cyclase class 2
LKVALFGEILLSSSACKKEIEEVIARIQDIESLDVSTVPLSKEKVLWFKNNLGFAATRYISSLEQCNKQESLMNIEFEAKFFVDPELFKKKLEQVGATLRVSDRLMRRKTFILPVDDLEAQRNMWGRVRDEGDRITMTVKHLSSATSIDGVREMELDVNDFDKACLFMQLTGCIIKSYQENYRETWEIDGCQVTIDRWPGLQPFVEIEGPDKKSVEDLLARFDVKAEEIFFGSIDVVYEERLGIPTVVFNQLPCVTFSTIDELTKKHGH